VTSTSAAKARPSLGFHGRSFMAYALKPQAPIADWLGELDKWARNSPGFFQGRAIVLDLAAVRLSETATAHLIAELSDRGIRIIGIEGLGATEKLGPDFPPLLKGGRATPVEDASHASAKSSHPEPASLLLEEPVRSGQSVIFPYGDVTVLGQVASGAEIVAGGSIHIYGTLRGRAMAGSMGNARARIFCSRNEAELLAIDGYYRTAEDMDPSLRNRPAQAWLEDAGLMIEALD
jgi:septum site-determining protein MinC